MHNEQACSEKTIVGMEDRPTAWYGRQGSGYLVRIYPAGDGQGLIRLDGSAFVIGRGIACDMDLADPSVSRVHACIELRDGQHFIVDNSSTNGTFVNDECVTECRLSGGNLVRVGSTIFKYLARDHVETQFHETIYSMMITDGLTGAYNKRFFMETLEREVVRSQRHARPLSLAMFDIDHFKLVNDTHGHLAGDIVLRELCNRIAVTIRKDEVFARCGGEEFGVVLPEASFAEAKAFGERIRRIVCDSPVRAGSRSIDVSISVGIAHTAGEREITPHELISIADRHMYAAKKSGRNCVCC